MTGVRASDKLRNAARHWAPWLTRPRAPFEKWAYARGWRSTEGLRLPDFLCLGAQKAGTTWLHRNLQPHPEVFLPPGRKELRFFDQRFYLSLREYAANFAAAGARRAGDITPNYGALSARRIAFVRRVVPEARLILILRNPIERAWSHALMDLATSRGRDPMDVADWEWRAHFRSRGSRRNGEYAAMLARWRAQFPREQLLVLFYEQLGEAPRELLTRVFRHIRVAEPGDWSAFPHAERIHAGPGLPVAGPDLALLRDLYREDLAALAAEFGDAVRSWR
jgi:hypothetical protein